MASFENPGDNCPLWCQAFGGFRLVPFLLRLPTVVPLSVTSFVGESSFALRSDSDGWPKLFQGPLVIDGVFGVIPATGLSPLLFPAAMFMLGPIMLRMRASMSLDSPSSSIAALEPRSRI